MEDKMAKKNFLPNSDDIFGMVPVFVKMCFTSHYYRDGRVN